MIIRKYRDLFSNTMIFAVSNVLSKTILILLLPLFTRFLTAEQYGIAEMLTTISGLLIPVCSIAIQEAVFRFSIEKGSNVEDVLKSGLHISALSLTVILFFSWVFRFYNVVGRWWPYLFAISTVILFRNEFSLYVKAVNKTKIFALDIVIYNSGLVLFNAIFLCFFNIGLYGYFFSIFLSNIVSIIFLVVSGNLLNTLKIGKKIKKLEYEMITYSAPLVINSVAWSITHLTDKMMLSFYGSTSDVGIYSAASKIPSVLSLVTNVFLQAWTIAVIRDYEREKDGKFYKNIFMITHFSLLIAAHILLLVNNRIIPIVLGDSFRIAVSYIPMLLLGTAFLTYSNFYSPIYSAMKLTKHIMYSSVGGAVLNVVLNMILIPHMGIQGACVATTIAYGYIALKRMYYCDKILKIEIDFSKLFVSLGLLCFVSFLCILDLYGEIASIVSASFILILYRREIIKLLNSINMSRIKYD